MSFVPLVEVQSEGFTRSYEEGVLASLCEDSETRGQEHQQKQGPLPASLLAESLTACAAQPPFDAQAPSFRQLSRCGTLCCNRSASFRREHPGSPGAARCQARLYCWPHQTQFPHGEAIEFLRRTIRAHPGEVVLLGIGPLTNLALLFCVDPDIPALLKALVLMCGVFEGGPALPEREWNALNDPHATAIVYRAPVPIHRSFGLDVTMRVRMSVQQFRERCSVPLLRPILDFAEVWFAHTDTVIFHDPLAAASLFAEDICTYTPGTVEVNYASEQLGGKTLWHPGGSAARHEVALQVRPERFFEAYFEVF
ncbi:MAG: nucleoside hydrolase [Ktedonobacteraceae bacterium]|nr:nucleoside hydrolase [Ktedonobacteraceae bacterium]